MLTLMVHLQPYHVETRLELWITPATPAKATELARAQARTSKADVVLWYTVEGGGSAREVKVHLLDLGSGHQTLRTISMGKPSPGIERSMAIALRTLFGAILHHREVPLPQKQPANAPKKLTSAPVPATQPAATQPGPGRPLPLLGQTKAPRFHLAASYDLDLLPMGDEIRHGPTAYFIARPLPSVGLRLGIGFRQPVEDQAGWASWSRDFLYIQAAGMYIWSLGERWEAHLGGRIRGGAVFTSAELVGGTSNENKTLWELALGPAGGIAARIGPRLTMEAQILLAWLPVGHELLVQGQQVAHSGGLQASLCVSFHVEL